MIQGAPTHAVANYAEDALETAPIPLAPNVQDDVARTDIPGRARAIWTGAPLVLLAIGWIALLAAGLASAAPPGGLTPLRLAAWIGIGCGPLALLAILFLLLPRAGRELASHARASAMLRADAGALAAALATMTRRIEMARRELDGQAGRLATLGTAAAERIARAAIDLGGQAEAFTRTTGALDEATATARLDLGVLLADLPRAEATARALAERIRSGGDEADGAARLLSDILARLDQRAQAAGASSGDAASRLAEQLRNIEEAAASTEARMALASGGMDQAVDRALGAAASGVEETRRAVAGQSAALIAMVDQGKTAVDATGEDAANRLGERLDAIVRRVETIGAHLARQDEVARATLDDVRQALAAAEGFDRVIGSGGRVAETLVERMTELRRQAEAGHGLVAHAIPAALARVRLHAEQGLQAITLAGERGERLSDATEQVRARLAEADRLMERQQGLLDATGADADRRLAALRGKAEALRALLAETAAAISALHDNASGSLADALLRVRETAAAAGDQASDALTAAIPRAAQRLSESAARAMTAALADVGHAEIEAVGTAARTAVEAARGASARLAEQLRAIAQTSTAIEARIAVNRADTEAHDEASFARSIGLLIEALNSAAIDVERLLSTEVSDEAWRAYLRGDRGVFTRRAVRLLARTEAATIVQHYEEDPAFRELASRYIHDFEALIRRAMATADGTPMATAILSSDAGKLYVALAQAIERLRR